MVLNIMRKFIIIFILIISLTSCASKGLVTKKYESDFYRVPRLLSDSLMALKNPKFIIYGDIRQGWRFKEKFLNADNWCNYKMLIFPFYELYLLGNGVIGGINWLRHTPDCGGRERRMVREAIYAEAQRSQVDFIFNSGDFVADGRRPTHWGTFLKENKVEHRLLLDFPFLPMVGNHEWANDSTYGLPNYQAIFPYPQFYTVKFLNAEFFIVDSDIIIDQYQLIDDEWQDKLFEKWFVSDGNTDTLAWLEEQLANCDKDFKIVIMHHPPISFNGHHSDWAKCSYGNNLPQKRKQLLELFQKQGVRVVLCSHEHLYEHNILKSNTDEDGMIHFVVSGGGGVPLRNITSDKKKLEYLHNYQEEGLDVELLRQEKIYHYCLVDVISTQVTIKVFEVIEETDQPVRLVETIFITG